MKDVHFWHHCDQLFSDFCQLLEEGVNALSNRICATIAKCQFSSQEVREMKKMLLQHAVKYHDARDWICLQDQSTLTYQSLLVHCRQLEARCKQFQQAQAQGRAHLTSLASTSASKSSIHAILQSTTKQPCNRCGYTHLHRHCPAFNRKCINCNNIGHFTALSRKPHNTRGPATTPYRCREWRGDPQGQEEGHQVGHQVGHRADHQAEVDRLTGAHQGIPVTALHKTITEGHHIEEDVPRLLIGIRSAI